jgi:hypothetical protein
MNAIEGFKDAPAFGGGEARAAILNDNLDAIAILTRHYFQYTSRSGVFLDVAGEIAQDLFECVRVKGSFIRGARRKTDRTFLFRMPAGTDPARGGDVVNDARLRCRSSASRRPRLC